MAQGIAHPQSLADFPRLDADLEVRCLVCHHKALFESWQIIAFFYARGWNTAWRELASRFRCDVCGSKQVAPGISAVTARLALPKPKPTSREVREAIRRARD